MTLISEFLPGPVARGDGEAYAEALWSEVTTLEASALDLATGLKDLNDATGLALDILGDWVSEERIGLEDVQYRRIIAGRRVALAGGVTPAGVVRGWRAVTGTQDVLLIEGTGTIILRATVGYFVDPDWKPRIAAVARDLIPNGRELYATIQGPGAYIWGQSSYDEHGFSTDFRAN